MALTVTVLGCSGTYAAPGGACSGYLVRSDTTALWMDAGPGTLGNLQRHVALGDVDALFVSHVHPDHWLELPVLRNALKYGVGVEDFPVYGTAETKVALSLLVDEVAPTIEWHTVAGGMVVGVGDLSLSFSRTDHPVETLAIRVDHDGRSLAYSADTGPGWALSELSLLGAGGPVNLALCEASLLRSDERKMQHLSARQAGISARSAEVERLILTHLVPGRDPDAALAEAADVFAGPAEVARLGATYEV